LKIPKSLYPLLPLPKRRQSNCHTPPGNQEAFFTFFTPRKRTKKHKKPTVGPPLKKNIPANHASRRNGGFGKAAHSASGFSLRKTFFRFSSTQSKIHSAEAFPKNIPERTRPPGKSITLPHPTSESRDIFGKSFGSGRGGVGVSMNWTRDALKAA
jgi:hypothetical protein